MKQVNFTFLLTLLISMVGAKAFAYDARIDGIYYDFSGTEATVTYCDLSFSGNRNAYRGKVVIPESVFYNGTTYSVTSIGFLAFHTCTSLTSVTIPNSVTSIGNYVFSGCSDLTSIIVENGNSMYDSRDNCNAIIKTETNELISGCKNTVIPNSVTSIGDYAFSDCSGLTSVTIPNSVTSIGRSAFSGTAWYDNQPNGLIYAGKVAYKYKGAMPENTTIVLEEGTVGIAGDAFSNCSGLISVTIPNSVTSIGDYAFEGCSGLTSVTIPNSVTSIELSAFYKCTGLTSVTIGSGVKIIGDFAFASCSKLTDVYCLAEEVPNTATTAFESSYIIENTTLYVPSASIDAYKANEPWKNFKEIKPLTDGNIPVKCATPTISFVGGKLMFSCDTEDVEYNYEVTNADVKKGSASEVVIGGTYRVSVYAAKAGLEDSDVATLEFTLGSNGEVCDVNKDGTVDVADIATIISEMAARARMQEEMEE